MDRGQTVSPDPPLVYTAEQTAQLLRCGRTATYEAIRRGEIPSVRIGRSIRVPRHALEQMLTAAGTDSPQTNGAGETAPLTSKECAP